MWTESAIFLPFSEFLPFFHLYGAKIMDIFGIVIINQDLHNLCTTGGGVAAPFEGALQK